MSIIINVASGGTINIAGSPFDASVDSRLDFISSQLNSLTMAFNTLEERFTALETAVATERQQILDALAELQEANADLQLLVADGGTVEQRAALALRMENLTATVAAIIPDVPPVG